MMKLYERLVTSKSMTPKTADASQRWMTLDRNLSVVSYHAPSERLVLDELGKSHRNDSGQIPLRLLYTRIGNSMMRENASPYTRLVGFISPGHAPMPRLLSEFYWKSIA